MFLCAYRINSMFFIVLCLENIRFSETFLEILSFIFTFFSPQPFYCMFFLYRKLFLFRFSCLVYGNSFLWYTDPA